jgi:hypothetical protein
MDVVAVADAAPIQTAEYLIDNALAWAAFSGERDAWQKLAQQLLSCSVLAQSPLIQNVVGRFCGAFAAELAPALSKAGISFQRKRSTLPMADAKAGSGIVSVIVRIGRAQLVITAAAPELWPDIFATISPEKSIKLKPVSSALSETSVVLQVSLPTVRIALPAIGQLAVGDFISFSQGIAGAVVVRALNADVAFHGRLGQADGHRAIQINSTLTENKHERT